MRFKRILLVNPPYPGSRVKAIFSAGLGYIAEILKTQGFEYDVLDMSLGYAYLDLKKKIKDFNPELVAVSMMTYKYKHSYGLIRRIKRDFPHISIVAGGPHISLFREKTLRDCPQLDFGVVMEGEETIIELCRGNDIASIKGLVHRQADNVVYNGDRLFIENLDSIPFPKYEHFELERSINKRNNALPIVSSRGCPFECIYCPVQCAIGRSFRMRSPQNIISEISYWYGLGYRKFSFADDNFTLVKERVDEICRLLMQSGMRDLRLSCDNGIRADKVDHDLLKAMKEANFFRIAIGVEAGNNKVLKALKKSEQIDTIKKAISDACALGFEVDLFFLVGSPEETPSDLEDSFKIALGYPIGTAFFYNIVPIPGTELFSWIKTHARLLKDPEDYLDYFPILDNDPLFETTQMPRQVRKKMLKVAFGIMRQTMRRAWSKRLKRFGALGALLSFIYTTKLMQDILLRNRLFKALALKLAGRLITV
jgi:anaerobic magnesium-protoporphyrin IX monomethyl ester cyclase